jgi:hypothetical protein
MTFRAHPSFSEIATLIGLAALVGASFFSGCGCCPCDTKTQPVVLCQVDAGASGEFTEQPFEADKSMEASARQSPCARACIAFANLGCPEATKKPAGFTCIENCHNLLAKPGFSSFNPECVAASTTLDAVRSCPAVRCKK